MKKYATFKIDILVPDNIDADEDPVLSIDVGSFEELLGKFLDNRAVNGLQFEVSEELPDGAIQSVYSIGD